tara:strand:+ start:1047 stop:1391 length:345 start_codon:yes stop_codon:yes gene_type:complete
MAYARGKYAKSISDRSGQQFPYREMVKEWNGSLVHISEFERKHPQLDPKPHRADPEALYNSRPQRAAPVVVDLNPALWPGQFTSDGMRPSTDANTENNKRRLQSTMGSVTISIS